MRTKGEPGTGNVVEAVRHLRAMNQAMRRIQLLDDSELMTEAKNLGAPYELVKLVKKEGKLPVPNFAAGGIATPADAALCMQLGAETVFVGSGIFKSDNPAMFAKAIVKATAHFNDPKMVLEASKGLGAAMSGIEISKIEAPMRMANRGW
jgi:pyridoxal 5'-phosphate synthase pdxS subunit